MASKEVEEALAALKAAAANNDTELAPIGVPQGYVAERDRPAGGIGPYRIVAPRYFEGDEFVPASLPGPKIAELQRQLAAAGLLKEYVNGYWDGASQAAYATLLGEANASGYTYEQQMRQRANAAAEDRQVRRAARLKPDPATLRLNAKALVKQTVGRDATDEEIVHLSGVLDSFTKQADEADLANEDAAAAALAAGQPAPGGQQVDPQARFEEYLSDRYRPEIQMREGVADLSQSRENLMGSIFAIDQAVRG